MDASAKLSLPECYAPPAFAYYTTAVGPAGLAGPGSRPDNVALLAADLATNPPGGVSGSAEASPPQEKKPPAAPDPLSVLTTDTGDCSEAACRRPGEPCSTGRVLAALQDFVVATGPQPTKAGPPPPPAEAVQAAKAALGCDSEACVITHPSFVGFVDGGRGAVAAELGRRFKTAGPRDTTGLLSNYDIDGVLQEWAAARPDFYNYDFNMMDFEVVGSSLARVDPADILEGGAPQDLGRLGGRVRRRCSTFACVVNTDRTAGKGKHWVAVFGDCRGRGPWSVEYFNSSGNPPPPPITRWLEETAARLALYRAAHARERGAGAVAAVAVTDVRHQSSKTECGLYALYYIRRRLEGAPYADFQAGRVPDAAMTEFRKHVFRAP